MKKVKKEKEYRKFKAEALGLSAFSLVLTDVPEPDPGVMDFRKKELMNARKSLFQESDLVPRLINRLGKNE